jgi:hypothetical protein
MQYQLGSKIIIDGQPFTHNKKQYPGNWIQLVTQEERDALGLVEIIPEPEPILPPTEVDMAQARLALLSAGLLLSVQSAIDSLPSPDKEVAQIEWEFRQTVKRTSPLVQSLASSLGLTESDLDNLFLVAKEL